MSVTHVAGPCVIFGKADRLIQRCAVCGYKLEDVHPSRLAFPTTDERGLPKFGEGRMIQVNEGNPKRFLDVGDFQTGTLPDDFCLSLVEEP